MCDIASLLTEDCKVPRHHATPAAGLRLLADACLSFATPPSGKSLKRNLFAATPPSNVSTKLRTKLPDVTPPTFKKDADAAATATCTKVPRGARQPFKERPKPYAKSKKHAVAAGRIFKGPWRPSETALLMRLVRQHGARNWAEIAEYIPGRTGKQARERWKNHLDPTLKKGAWAPHEDALIERRYRAEGCKWSRIARLLPGRSDNDVKNRFNSAIRARLHLAPKRAKRAAHTRTCARPPPIYVPPNLRWQLPAAVVEPTMFNLFQ